uniref:Uncharacterized protein n=1 Tax=Anopheles melas TaxID=34690 RepID=A0A182UF59_9DIPT
MEPPTTPGHTRRSLEIEHRSGRTTWSDARLARTSSIVAYLRPSNDLRSRSRRSFSLSVAESFLVSHPQLGTWGERKGDEIRIHSAQMQWERNARKPTGRGRSVTAPPVAGRFYLCYTQSTRDTLAVCVTRSGDPPLDAPPEPVTVDALLLPPLCPLADFADGEDGMPSLLALLLLPPFVAPFMAAVGMTVFSRSSDESSDMPPNALLLPVLLLLLPPPAAAPTSFEDDDPSPPSDPLLTPWLLPTEDSIVELISGRPISWNEFIELKPLSSSAELDIIISLIRSMFALYRWAGL